MTSLTRQQLQLNLLAEAGHTGFWTYQHAEPKLWADAVACRLMRCTTANSLERWLGALDANERLAVQSDIAHACTAQSGFVRHVCLQTGSGEIEHLALRGRWREASPSGAGELVCMVERAMPADMPRKIPGTDYQQLEHIYKVLLASPIALFEQDTNLRYRWVFAPRMGLHADALVGKVAADFLLPPSALESDKAKRAVLASGKPAHARFNMQTKEGRRGNFDVYIAPTYAPGGEVNGVVTVSVDLAEAAERDARLLAAFDQAPVGIVLVRLPSAEFVYVNATFERLSGYTKTEAIGTRPNTLQLWQPPDRGRYFFKMLERDGHVRNRSAAYRRKDGTIGRALISAERVEIDGESLSLCTIHDQSELEDARSMLALSEARYQLLAEASFEGVALVRNGLVVEVNTKMASILGVPQAELVDGSASRRLANVLPATPQAFAAGFSALRKIDYVRPEGHTVSLEMCCRELEHGGGGTYIITLRDITEKIQKERTLKNLQASMAHLMDSGMVGMMAVEVKGTVLDANDYILHLLQRSRAELEAGALNWVEMTPPEYLVSAEHQRMHELVLATGRCPAFERPMLKPDGSVVHLLIAVVLQPDSIDRALVIALDLTAYKKTQGQLLELNAQLEKRTRQAERAEAVKSLFLSSISHELRTPMHTILGYVRLLRKKAQPEDDEQLAIVERRGTHLLQLIDDLLEFNHTAVAPDNLRMEFIDMDGFVRSLESMFGAMAEQTGNQFHLQLPKVLPLGIVQDEGRLVQILRILVDNACKYTTEGHITLSLDCQQAVDPEGRCRLSFAVQDSGRGIVDADLLHIFEPMRRGQNADDRPGLGLGLAIAEQWIHRMGSRIAVQSQFGVGSCFRFALLLEASFEVVPRWREPHSLRPAPHKVRGPAQSPTLPEEELAMLGQLINMGRMGRLGTWARELAANHPELQALADQVASLAALAEVDALQRLYQRSLAQHAGQ